MEDCLGIARLWAAPMKVLDLKGNTIQPPNYIKLYSKMRGLEKSGRHWMRDLLTLCSVAKTFAYTGWLASLFLQLSLVETRLYSSIDLRLEPKLMREKFRLVQKSAKIKSHSRDRIVAPQS